MSEWKKGGPLGSLRKRVARQIRQHIRSNATLVAARRPLSSRILQAFFGKRGLLEFLTLYVLLVVLLLGAEVSLERSRAAAAILRNFIDATSAAVADVTGYLLAAQVTMLGLLFPIAVALVTLITNRDDTSSVGSDIQVYYGETFAYGVGASGIALAAVLAGQLVWPENIVATFLDLRFAQHLTPLVLTSIHLVWLLINFVALWHFLSTSLSFMRPRQRAILRRRYAAATTIPHTLATALTTALFITAEQSLLARSSHAGSSDDGPSVNFHSVFNTTGVAEVSVRNSRNKVLYDVWMRPLGWVLNRWVNRSGGARAADVTGHSQPLLMLPVMPGEPLNEDGVICRRQFGEPLTRFERFVVRRCFRLKRARP